MQTKTQHSPIDRRTLAIRGGIALALSLVVNGLIVGIVFVAASQLWFRRSDL